jgi:hypothetical protein
VPEHRRLGIFNRFYFEEVLIIRVNPAILKRENVLDALLHEKAICYGRYAPRNPISASTNGAGSARNSQPGLSRCDKPCLRVRIFRGYAGRRSPAIRTCSGNLSDHNPCRTAACARAA